MCPFLPTDASDGSNGYEAAAGDFMIRRSPLIGVETVREWAADFAPRANLLDLGCGNGKPITQVLVDSDFEVFGVDASARMIAALRTHLPSVQAECATVEKSGFFARTFDGVIAWGLVFLLPPETQALLIRKVARVLNEQGRFLFTAPRLACEWLDSLTGRTSISLGIDAYLKIFDAEGLILVDERQCEGGNHYYLTAKRPAATHLGK